MRKFEVHFTANNLLAVKTLFTAGNSTVKASVVCNYDHEGYLVQKDALVSMYAKAVELKTVSALAMMTRAAVKVLADYEPRLKIECEINDHDTKNEREPLYFETHMKVLGLNLLVPSDLHKHHEFALLSRVGATDYVTVRTREGLLSPNIHLERVNDVAQSLIGRFHVYDVRHEAVLVDTNPEDDAAWEKGR